jgi:hypothetical protein
MAHVPLERQSTSRLLIGFIGMVLVPCAAAAALIAYCLLHFTSSFVDFVSHIPML